MLCHDQTILNDRSLSVLAEVDDNCYRIVALLVFKHLVCVVFIF